MPSLHVVMYHYVRDLPNTPLPRLKGMLTSTFRQQLRALREHYELATLETALAFMQGAYMPARDLCLLTFDDGLKEPYTEVMPLLVEHGIQGIFFLITSCDQPLAMLSPADPAWDMRTCQQLVQANLHPQADWPFSYPYGKTDTFNTQTITHLRALGVTCAFCTEVGNSAPGNDLFAIRRIDCKDAPGGHA